MEDSHKDALQALASRRHPVLVRAATSEQATHEVKAWAEGCGLPVVDVSPFYATDLRGEPYVSGTPSVSGRAMPPWLVPVLDADAPRLLLWPDVTRASASMPQTNVAVLNNLAKDRETMQGRIPDGCWVVVTAAVGEGGVPGLQSDCFAHLALD